MIDNWRYQVSWKPVPDPARRSLSGTWPVVVPASRAGDELVAEVVAGLERHGANVVSVVVDERDLDASVLAERLREVAGRAPELGGVLSLLALDEEPCPGHPAMPNGYALSLVSAMVARLRPGSRPWIAAAPAVGEVLALTRSGRCGRRARGRARFPGTAGERARRPSLYRLAAQQGESSIGMELLVSAAKLRPTFEEPGRLRGEHQARAALPGPWGGPG
ncbi:hypothetical protein SANTM175S_03560 [Streptomyces antimycoticus]